jgi:arylsulfatase A-like enzyme
MRTWAFPFFACLIMAAGVCGCVDRGPARTPSLLLISIDTLRSDMLGCYGQDRPTSPTLDLLATEGVLFENAFTTSPWTLPAHASLLTGLYPRHHGARTVRHALRSAVPTLAEILSKEGFATMAVVNSYYLVRRYGFSRGFDEFVYVKEEMSERGPSEVVDEALSWLSKSRERPFFLFLHAYDVHSDYGALPEYEKIFLRPYDGVVDGTTEQLLEFRQESPDLSTRDLEHLIDLYAAGIRQTDAELARLIDHLRTTGDLENTLIILTSDHGEEFLEHGSLLHARTQYDEVIRIPLLLRGPGVLGGRRVVDPVSINDILPTALVLLGVAWDGASDGVDLSPLWRNGPSQAVPERVLFGEADQHNERPDITRSARYGRYKLIYNRLSRESELYDLRADPREQHDVSASRPEITRQLMEELDRFESVRRAGERLPALDEETRRHLERLGYVQNGGGP